MSTVELLFEDHSLANWLMEEEAEAEGRSKAREARSADAQSIPMSQLIS